MSISVTISNPLSKEQQVINIPVATEASFRNLWQIGSSELGLTWVSLFDAGVEISKDDVGELIAELERLSIWAKERSHKQQEVVQMQDRIQRMINEIPKIVSQGNDIFIG